MLEFNEMIKAFGNELQNEYYMLWYLDRIESILRKINVSSVWNIGIWYPGVV